MNEHNYLKLLHEVMEHGAPRETRAGSTRQLFGAVLRLDLREGLPLLTTRRIAFRPILGEFAAFLTGSTDLRTFKELGCNYWDANALAWQRAAPSGLPPQVGKIYGYQWRRWNGGYDQLQALVDGLVHEPTSRRHVVTTWNPNDLDDMCLPPCHLLCQFQVDGDFLDCCVYMRSVDVCLGLPADMVLYSLLMHLVGNCAGRSPRRLVFMLADTHVYENHLELAQQQLRREPAPAPRLDLDDEVRTLDQFTPDKVSLRGYMPQEAIHYVLNV